MKEKNPLKAKQFLYGVYAIFAVIAVIIGFAVYWEMLVSTDTAFIPIAGAGIPLPIPIPHQASSRMITLDGITLNVAVADIETLREKGLSGLSGLSDDEGMLFVFPDDGIYSFWMKDMRFAIDMLWLDARGRVVHIEKSVSPETYPKAFTPSSPSRYVLEVRAGFSDQHDIRIGSKANLE